ncbi:MAG: 5-formyltetrahydrofolate cyclo-ligase [Lachnospiraceae bacterium]|nr:5-formyltetrahydrofolate cyclo-ligase [Lachnospiraceae bacterium]
MTNNNELRKTLLAKRNSLSKEEVSNLSQIIENKLVKEINNFKSKNILCYYPLNNEVNLLKLYEKLLDDGYNLYFPVTYRDTIRFYLVDNLTDFTKGTFEVHEPDNRNIEFRGKEALVITPGLAFDKDNNRIGYGRGYYDRFLRHNKQTTPIGVCYRFQIVDDLYSTPYDVPVTKVITD